MSDISQEYSDDEDITPYNDNMHDSDGFAAVTRSIMTVAGEGPIDTDGYNGDGTSVSSSSHIGESYEVSGVEDLDPELQATKGSPAEILFYSRRFFRVEPTGSRKGCQWGRSVSCPTWVTTMPCSR